MCCKLTMETIEKWKMQNIRCDNVYIGINRNKQQCLLITFYKRLLQLESSI